MKKRKKKDRKFSDKIDLVVLFVGNRNKEEKKCNFNDQDRRKGFKRNKELCIIYDP